MSTLQIKSSAVSSRAPTSLALGEFAVNVTDNKLWIGTSSGVLTIPLDAIDLPNLQTQININKKLDDAIALSIISM